jgi:hypothetical protein
MGTVKEVLAEQLAANRSSSGLQEAFSGHRARLTELCARDTPFGSERSLCVLGAGNVNDLELEELTARYRSVVLVDIDADALEGAVARQSPAARSRLVCRAPVDVSGMLGRLERWASLEVTADELADYPRAVAADLHFRLGGPFDVVLSSCLLTQMQLGLLTVLGDRHPLFEAARFTLNLAHFRTLCALTAPGGRLILASDLTSSELAPAIARVPAEELPELVERLTAAGSIFQVASPVWLREMVKDDPTLSAELELAPALPAWLWQNGVARTFLVTALEGRRRTAGGPPVL